MDGKEFYVKTEDLTVYREVKEDQEGRFSLIQSFEDMKQFTKEQLVTIRTNIRGKASEADAKKSLKKLAFECFNEGMNPKPAKEPKPPKAPKAPKEKAPAADKKPSKMEMIRTILGEKRNVSRKELAEAIGSDEQNTHTMISILKNPERTKIPIFVNYDKPSSSYTWFETAEEMQQAIRDEAAEAERAKEALKNAAAGPKVDE